MKTRMHMLAPALIVAMAFLSFAPARLPIAAAHPMAPAIMQDANGFLEVEERSGRQFWPNSGTMPILTFGWGGDRPRPVYIAVDSSRPPLTVPGRPPVLIVQRRNDLFSPLFEDILQQNEPFPRLVLTINRIHGSPLTYTLFNTRVIGIRNVGKVIEENPSTEEIVFVFERMVEGR